MLFSVAQSGIALYQSTQSTTYVNLNQNWLIVYGITAKPCNAGGDCVSGNVGQDVACLGSTTICFPTQVTLRLFILVFVLKHF